MAHSWKVGCSDPTVQTTINNGTHENIQQINKDHQQHQKTENYTKLNEWMIETPQEQWITEWMCAKYTTTGAVNYWMDGCGTPQEQWIIERMGVRHHRNSEILNEWVVDTEQIQSRHHRSSELLNGWVWDTTGWSRHYRSSELLNGWMWDTTGTVKYWMDGW